MNKPLLLGTNNRHKAEELSQILAGLPWEIKILRDYPQVPEVEEDGRTFEENALKKARYYGEQFGVTCVADDSGLVVDALDGAPGIYSARYAGEDCSYEDNNRKLLAELAAVPDADRTARFVCCAAVVFPDGREHVEIGVVEGRIGRECRGDKGFGYDPLFIPDGYDRYFAELEPEEKHAISHRGRAFRKLRDFLESQV